LKFKENEYGRIFNLNEFAYWKITVCQPNYDKKGKILKDKMVEIENNISQIENAINLLQEYRTRFILDVVTGNVNVQNVKVPEFEAEDE
jgi:division protein CdvB (Snf7/Vps24/ESCRT-III family)